MNTLHFLISGWHVDPVLLPVSILLAAAYLTAFGTNARFWRFFVPGIAVLALTLASPLNALADGYLFSAHMAQHILLLLAAPGLMLLGLPRGIATWKPLRKVANPFVCWVCGIGAMWFWHVPALCNAATTSAPVHLAQTLSLLVMGGAFWWQIIQPDESARLSPPAAVIYLFTACTACTVLGIIVTFSPISVCPIYTKPVDHFRLLTMIRDGWGMTPTRDQQIGGLLMWVPMCLIYLGAIIGQITRWYTTDNVTTVQPCEVRQNR